MDKLIRYLPNFKLRLSFKKTNDKELLFRKERPKLSSYIS